MTHLFKETPLIKRNKFNQTSEQSRQTQIQLATILILNQVDDDAGGGGERGRS